MKKPASLQGALVGLRGCTRQLRVQRIYLYPAGLSTGSGEKISDTSLVSDFVFYVLAGAIHGTPIHTLKGKLLFEDVGKISRVFLAVFKNILLKYIVRVGLVVFKCKTHPLVANRQHTFLPIELQPRLLLRRKQCCGKSRVRSL
jgi:hypothetical protein